MIQIGEKKVKNQEILPEVLSRKFLRIYSPALDWGTTKNFPVLEYTELELGNKTRS